MDEMAAMFVEGMRRARLGEAYGGDAGAGQWQTCRDTALDTPPGLGGHGFGAATTDTKNLVEHPKITFTSRGASIYRMRGRSLGVNGAKSGAQQRQRTTICTFETLVASCRLWGSRTRSRMAAADGTGKSRPD
jgi:hypothetical protein